MGTYPSARGQKRAEQATRPEGRNTIVTVWQSAGQTHVDWGPDYEAAAANLGTIENALDATLVMGRHPLLWTYSKPDANYTELKFGFDDPIADNKIGHVAMAFEATISGEIFRDGAQWRINNESGAWGNMGGQTGKSRMLIEAAEFISEQCAMQVTANKAYSSNALKRWVQKRYR